MVGGEEEAGVSLCDCAAVGSSVGYCVCCAWQAAIALTRGEGTQPARDGQSYTSGQGTGTQSALASTCPGG